MSTRKTKKEATKVRILQVARDHFEKNGFAGTNLRLVAKESGVVAGTVILHFTDKLGLLHASLHEDLEHAIESSLNTQNEGSLFTQLCNVLGPFFDYYSARPALSKTMLRESLLADSPWKERFGAQFMRVNIHIFSMVEIAKKEGELSKDCDTEMFTYALFSFYYFTLIAWVQGGPEPMPIFKKLLNQHLQSYRTD